MFHTVLDPKVLNPKADISMYVTLIRFEITV